MSCVWQCALFPDGNKYLESKFLPMLVLPAHAAKVRRHYMRPVDMPVSFISILVPCSHQPSWCDQKRFAAVLHSLPGSQLPVGCRSALTEFPPFEAS